MTDIYEDDIDAETLQAQVDMSVAFTENLVASWMKPSKGKLPSAKNRRQDEERELEEYMRRPPRLGVGAAIPESTSAFGRDTARLKHKLVGKKRAREEERDLVKAESDNEEESRAGAIKKKAKVDPFAKIMAPQQKKSKLAANTQPPASIVKVEESMKQEHLDGTNRAESPIEDIVVKQENFDSPRKKKKKKRAAKTFPVGSPSLKPNSSVSVASADTQEVETILSAAGRSILVPSRKFSPRLDSTPKGKTPTVFTSITPPSSKVKHEDVPPRRLSSPHAHHSCVEMETPLLNLEGPPQRDPDDGGGSLKKRRKRKKKKKTHGDDRSHEEVKDEDEST